MHQTKQDGRRRAVVDAALTVAGAAILGAALTLRAGVPSPHAVAATAFGLVVPTVAAISVLRRRPRLTTAADRVTLTRIVLTGGCATLVVLSLWGDLPLRSWPLFVMALPAYLLDGVDGWVARRTNTASAAGGRLDMESDAVLFLILSVPLSLSVGPWVLGIGVMRYLFGAASWWRPALRGSLAFSRFRRIVAGTQGGVLVAALIPVLPVSVAAVATAVSLALLMVSFGRDVLTLENADAPPPRDADQAHPGSARQGDWAHG
ncbi:CDP-alcohol phosphatidyltransferase family protein [Tessaracoccus antarcticus]|uniref:CDP-alcohol phosphatidyltransferase family protein n=1 Tax=Tessaracoccus antarcticus TaxID=2479848 RepID=UPI0018F68F20|nr:CDP-alcohol phosphatidyltransferase family protein [Tessaracoccus antarcticus]